MTPEQKLFWGGLMAVVLMHMYAKRENAMWAEGYFLGAF